MLGYTSDGSFIEIAPGLVFGDLLDSDGSFVAFSQFGLANNDLTAVDYRNPGTFLNPEDTSTGVRLDAFGVNANGDLVGDLDGLVSGAFTSSAGTSRFLPGPESSFGFAIDINNTGLSLIDI